MCPWQQSQAQTREVQARTRLNSAPVACFEHKLSINWSKTRKKDAENVHERGDKETMLLRGARREDCGVDAASRDVMSESRTLTARGFETGGHRMYFCSSISLDRIRTW